MINFSEPVYAMEPEKITSDDEEIFSVSHLDPNSKEYKDMIKVQDELLALTDIKKSAQAAYDKVFNSKGTMGKDEYDVKLAEAQLALDKNLSAFEAASYRHKEAHEAIVQYSSSKRK